MKKGITILMGIFLVSVLANAVHVQGVLVTASDIDIVLTNQNPNPVEPGNIVDIEIEIQNDGFAEATDQVIEFVEKDPFILIAGEDKIKTFNRIASQTSVKVSYKVKVSPDAQTNTYDLDLKMYSEGSVVYITKTVSIIVQGEPKLVIENIVSDPEVLEPSGIGELQVILRNAGTGTARQLQAALIPNASFIVPILSGGLEYVDMLGPDESTTLTFNIGIDTEADYKTYDSIIKIDYKDESGTENEETFSIGIPVTGTIFLDVIKIEPNYERGVLRIEVANKGTTSAKSVEAKLVVNDEILDIDYISQIKANKQTTFDFPIVLSGSGKLVLNYIGPGLEKNTVEKDVVLSFDLPSGGNGTVNIVLGIVVLIVLYFLLRKFVFKKKKK